VQLRELELQDHDGCFLFTSTQLAACLARLSNLEKLHLDFTADFRSLSFLSAGSLSRTLTELSGNNFCRRLPLREFEHLLVLRELRSLMLRNVFDAPPGAPGLTLVAPPHQPPLLSWLTEISHHYRQATV